jgi:hypothetical protein
VRTTATQAPHAPSTPANRAERRAAARGRSVGNAQPAPARSQGPRERTKPLHVRTDFAARRTG